MHIYPSINMSRDREQIKRKNRYSSAERDLRRHKKESSEWDWVPSNQMNMIRWRERERAREPIEQDEIKSMDFQCYMHINMYIMTHICVHMWI